MRRTLSTAVLFLFVGAASPACKEKEQPVPATVADLPDGELAKQHRAIEVFTLVQEEGTYRVLVFKLPKLNDQDSDYRLVTYRKQEGVCALHGHIITMTNFERPRLELGPPPRIVSTERRFGVRYHLSIDQTGTDLVPSEGFLDGGGVIGHPPTR